MHDKPRSTNGEKVLAKKTIERRLTEADLDNTRSASVEDGTKECYDHDATRPPTEISGNYTVHGGDGLVIFDIDVNDLDELPDWVRSLPPTLVVETVHGGYHRYYEVENDDGISNTEPDWGSIRYDGWYTVGPGSTVDHEDYCDDGKEGCPGIGTDTYIIEADRLIPTLTGDPLERLREVCSSEGSDDSGTHGEYGGEKITLPDEDVVQEAEEYICAEFARRSTQLARSDLIDLLRGGTGSYDLRRENDPSSIDQSAADYYALDMLYGAFLHRGEDEDEARRLALAVFRHYCRENPHDKTGNLQKWLRKGDGYLTGEGVEWKGQMDAVQEEFDWGDWHRWRRRKYEDGFDAQEHRPWTDPGEDGVPSPITEDTVRAALRMIVFPVDPEDVVQQYGLDSSVDPDPPVGKCVPPSGSSSTSGSDDYPTASEVGQVASEINPDRESSYFEEVLKKLSRETGSIAHAYCPSRQSGERHVYYPVRLSDPSDARWVRTGGEEREPQTDGHSNATEQPKRN